MTYEQLLPVYQRITGKPGQDDDFNQWVQGIINTGVTQTGVEGIPDNFFETPAGGQYLAQTTVPGATPYTPPTDTGGGGGRDLQVDPRVSGFTALTPPTITGATVAQPSTGGLGGNYSQVQNANQGGNFSTLGTNNVNQQQLTGSENTQVGSTTGQQTGNTTTQGTQNTTGTQNQTGAFNQAGTTNTQGTTTGTTTTAPTDTLGFGALLRGQAGGVGATDAARGSFLTDVMQTGGQGFNSQVDQAVRQSLSGPRMSGAGESAQARAAGYAASDVARNNLNQRLGAAQQLAGPTGLATLSGAANPYIGSSTSTTGQTTNTGTNTTAGTNATSGTNTGTTSNTGQTISDLASSGTSNLSNIMSGFSNLTGTSNEATAGSASGASSQAGSGQIPQSQQVSSGGGCVVCTVGLELGLFRTPRVLRYVIDHKFRKAWPRWRSAAFGYMWLFSPLARAMLTHPRWARFLARVGKIVVYEELRIAGRPLPFRVGPWCVHGIGYVLCKVLGKTFVPHRVTDPEILRLARKHNVLMEVLP